MKFQRSIRLFPLLATSVGSMIGSGWLFGPLFAAHLGGPAAIFSWILAGILMVFIGITFIENAVNRPVVGGIIRFADYTHDSLVSFTMSWLAWLANVVLAPIETIAMLQYASNYFPMLVQQQGKAVALSYVGIGVAASILFLLVVLNRLGTLFFAKSNAIVVIFKFIVPIVTLITLFSLGFKVGNFTHFGGFFPLGWKGVLTALPMAGVMFSLIGFSSAIQMVGEAKNPKRNIPLAVFGSLLICVILYVLLQIVFIGVLQPEHLVSGWAHLSFHNINGPFAGIAGALGVTWLVMLIYADALFSPLGTGYIFTATSSRITYSLSQKGFFPGRLSKLNAKGVPARAMLANYVVGLVILLPFPGWQKLVPFFVLCVVIAYVMGPITAIINRYNTEQTMAMRIRGMPIIAPIAFYACSLIIYWTGWKMYSNILLAVAIGYLLFFVIKKRHPEREYMTFNLRQSGWLILYLLGMGVISYLGSFGGGKGVLLFGWDFVVIAVFSVISFYLAIASRRIT